MKNVSGFVWYMESLHGLKAVLLELLCVRTVLYVVGRRWNEIPSSIVFIPVFKIHLTLWTAAAVVSDGRWLTVSNGPDRAVCLSILSPKDVNESIFRSVFCSEYRTVAKVQELNGLQWYRQQSLLRALQCVLWHPLTSAGLLGGVASSMGDDHHEHASSAECWSQKFENFVYDGVKIERRWRLLLLLHCALWNLYIVHSLTNALLLNLDKFNLH